MKKIFFLFISLFALLAFINGDNQSIEVNHQLKSVTVYLDNAELFLSSNVNLQKGKTELIFRNISSRILSDGIKISANNSVKILSVQIDQDKYFVQNSTEFQAHSKKIAEFENQQSVINDKLELLDKQIEYLESNYKLSGINTANQTQIDEGMKYFNTKMEAILKQISVFEAQRKGVNDSIKKNKEVEKELIEQLEKRNSLIRVKVESEKATSSQIDVQYLVSNAVWLPLYAIRANEGSNQITIDYQAQVYNDSGLDWQQIPLTLAVINSTQDISIPELQPWTIVGNKKYFKVAKGDYSGKLNDEDGTSDGDFIMVDDLSTRFEISEKHNIPSDATPHIIDVKTYQKEADFYTLSIPKIKNGAFKIASIKDWESLNMIDGNANLYYNEAFQGKSFLNTQLIEDYLNVSVGLENSITVNRRNLLGKSRKSLMGISITEQFNYEILVKNNKSVEQSIQVKDQIPVSTSKDIEINTLDLSGAKLDPITGELSWNLNLKPNEVKKLVVSFSVKYPNSERFNINYNQNTIKSPRFF